MGAVMSQQIVDDLLHGDVSSARIQALGETNNPCSRAEALLAILASTWGELAATQRLLIWIQTWVVVGGVVAAAPQDDGIPWAVRWDARSPDAPEILRSLPPTPDLYRVLTAPLLITYAFTHPNSPVSPRAAQRGYGDLPSESAVIPTLRETVRQAIRNAPPGRWWLELLPAVAQHDRDAWTLGDALFPMWARERNNHQATHETRQGAVDGLISFWTLAQRERARVSPEMTRQLRRWLRDDTHAWAPNRARRKRLEALWGLGRPTP